MQEIVGKDKSRECFVTLFQIVQPVDSDIGMDEISKHLPHNNKAFLNHFGNRNSLFSFLASKLISLTQNKKK